MSDAMTQTGLSHTVEWKDGLKVVRVMTFDKQIVLWVKWAGKTREVRLGPRVSEIRRLEFEP